MEKSRENTRSSEYFRDEMEHFLGSFGERREEGNLSVKIRSDEFVLEHALLIPLEILSSFPLK